MIARVLALGRSFKKLISYLKTGKDGRQLQRDRVEWVEFRNLPTRNPDTAACMMAATASESVSGTQTAVYHFSISCDPGDPVDGGTLRQVADRTIRDLGLEEHQVLIFAHKDRSHPHLHFVVNRVHPDRGTLWRTWRDYYRLERSLRAQEQELGLQIVPGWNSVVVRDVDGRLRVPAEQETGLQRVYPASNPRRGDAEFLRDVRARAAQLLEQARGWADLERGLAEQGLSLRVKGGGFTLTDGTREVKASEVGRGCSRYHLEKRLGPYPDYRARLAVAQLPPAPRAPVQPEVAPPRGSVAVEAQTPAREEPATPPLPPTPQVPPRVEGRVHERRKPQFGDAGHGILALFGGPSTPEVERPAPAVERAPAPQPQPQRKERTFLREVQDRAGPVLERAGTWVELERGLADHGLSLREKGGGFVVTDGEREVKASEVGRAFSRFHLEKRLDQYPSSRARGSEEEVQTGPRAPAAETDPAARQAEQLALPLPVPAVQEGAATPARPTQRFTLYDDGTVFGVRDKDGQVFFAETRERAAAEVERANAIAALYPDVISMRHLREMDGAWRDARGLPHLPEPEGRRIVVPAPEGFGDGSPPLPPVARVQREEPGPAAAPPERATAPPERAPSPTPTSEPAVQPEPPRPVEPIRIPARGLEPPVPVRKRTVSRSDREGAPIQPAAPAPREPALPRGPIARGAQAPELPPELEAYLRVLTEAAEALDLLDQRQKAGEEFYTAADELAWLPERRKRADAAVEGYRLREVYADPAAAERAIAEHRKQHGTDATAGAIELSPERFGALRPDPDQGMISRLWRRDTHRARSQARVLVHYFRHAHDQLAARPTAQDEERVRARNSAAQRASDEVDAKLRRLPHTSSAEYARAAVRGANEAARLSGRSMDAVLQQAPRIGRGIPDPHVSAAARVRPAATSTRT